MVLERTNTNFLLFGPVSIGYKVPIRGGALLLELLLNDIAFGTMEGHFINHTTDCVTINWAKYQLIQMKLIRLGPSVVS